MSPARRLLAALYGTLQRYARKLRLLLRDAPAERCRMPAVPSPCTGICRIDPATDRCMGCRRTLDEIADWPALPPKAQRRLLDKLRLRRDSRLA